MAAKKSAKAAKKVVAKKSAPKKKQSATKKPISKKAIKKVVKSAVKKVAIKTAPKKTSKQKQSLEKDYFKLPFEVYYSEYVPVTSAEFLSDKEVKKFSDFRVMHQDQGGCWGLLMECKNNRGPELYCCISNGHDQVHPKWLSVIEEDSIDFNYAEDFAVRVQGNAIKFDSLSDDETDEDSDEYLDIFSMSNCGAHSFFAYHLGDATPDYLILDADDSRIKVDLEGYLLDEDLEPTNKRLFDPDELDEELFDKFENRDFWDMRSEWISGLLEAQFPKEKSLKYIP